MQFSVSSESESELSEQRLLTSSPSGVILIPIASNELSGLLLVKNKRKERRKMEKALKEKGRETLISDKRQHVSL